MILTKVEEHKILLSSSVDCTVKMWNMDGHYIGMYNTSLSHTKVEEHKILLSSSVDCTVRMWNIDGHCIGMLNIYESYLGR